MDVCSATLRGKFVRIVALGPTDTPPPAVGITQVLLMQRRIEMPGCVAEGDASWTAYAVLAHVPPEQLAAIASP